MTIYDDDREQGSDPWGAAAGITRDESMSKNPIRQRMGMDRLAIPPDRLTDLVARARDFFHSMVGQTLRRRYKRPPIYLVDGWVTQALGLFTTGDIHRGPSRGAGPRSGASPFQSVHAIFAALERVLESIAGIRVLDLQQDAQKLEHCCFQILQGQAGPAEIHGLGASVLNLVERALIVLSEDRALKGYVRDDFRRELLQALRALEGAAESFQRSGPPAMDLVSFHPERHSGVVFQSIPELDIEGPAILVSPSSILHWSRGMPRLPGWLLERQRSREGLATWFGLRHPEEAPFALALANVVQHELTHAMLALPNDPVEEEDALHHGHIRLYHELPQFEEGFANFIAALGVNTALLKAHFGIRGNQMPGLASNKYGPPFDELRPLFHWSYERYHEKATEQFLHAWECNGRNLKAFSGLAAVYATDVFKNDWEKTFEALAQGRVSTGSR